MSTQGSGNALFNTPDNHVQVAAVRGVHGTNYVIAQFNGAEEVQHGTCTSTVHGGVVLDDTRSCGFFVLIRITLVTVMSLMLSSSVLADSCSEYIDKEELESLLAIYSWLATQECDGFERRTSQSSSDVGLH